LVDQAVKLFGAQHYDHYEFPAAISDNLGGIGLEHHRSSEDGVDRGYFTIGTMPSRRNLLPHEITHSWNGKFRRGADLWTPDYRTPMEDSLMWVYEGRTQFWAMCSAPARDAVQAGYARAIAATAAAYGPGTPGRGWRPLIDTTNDQSSPNARRSRGAAGSAAKIIKRGRVDLDRCRQDHPQQSGGKRSIDDFARAFFGVRDRDWGELTYTLDDVVRTLSQVQPYDWRGYLQRKVYDIAAQPPFEGITRRLSAVFHR